MVFSKNVSNIHERIAIQTNKILMGDDSLPTWMTQDCTVLPSEGSKKKVMQQKVIAQSYVSHRYGSF